MVTLSPLACNSLASEAAMIPLPSEDVTPPVTKTYLAIEWSINLLLNALLYYCATGGKQYLSISLNSPGPKQHLPTGCKLQPGITGPHLQPPVATVGFC